MAFNFGASAAGSTGGFSFGAKTTASATPAAAATGFSFGANTAASTIAPGGLSFGSKPAAPGGFSFGQASAAASVPASSALSFGGTAPPTAGGFSFGASNVSAPPLSSVPSFSLGGAANTPSSFSLGSALSSAAAAPSVAPTLQQSKTVNPTAPFGSTGFTLGGSKPATSTAAPTSGLSFGTPTATTVPAPATTKSSLLGGFSAGLTSVASSTSLTTTTTAAAATSGLSLSSTAPVLKQMSYKELEETVEKWLYDLTEQEKSFLNQASQVNVWDKQLIENGEKVTELNNEVERVKAEQQRLDRELDFILSQQEELEELLKPIENEIKSQQVHQYSQHADVERERTFRLAENVDSQLKGMMQDLREIIEHINNSNDKPTAKVDDTMSSIAKILNAHMDSLQWVDQNSNQLQRRVDEVSHLLESRKRDHERSFHLTY